MTSSLSFAAPLRRFATLSMIALLPVLSACGDDPTGIPNDIGLPTRVQASGSVAQGGTAIVRFVAGRSGETSIRLCGPAGTNFNMYLAQAAASGSGSGNCETLTFDAVIGTVYRLEVTSASGSGPFNLCVTLVGSPLACDVAAPVIDASIPAGYYSLAEGRTGTALVQALHQIIDDQRVLGYNAARDSMYGFVDDPDNDDVIIELYIGDLRDSVLDRASALLADLNAEHTWPQSLGAEEDPANSDLHVIYPADETANNRRSNNPFGMVVRDTTWVSPLVTTPEEQSVLGRDAQNRVVFEPRDSKKGDIARALLYFFVRYNYQRTPSFSLSNFGIEEATLLEWARLDPVDAYERSRNNLVYRAQGNRNPFVDRPDFLDAVGDFPN